MGAYVAVKAGYFSTHAAFPDIQEASSIGTYCTSLSEMQALLFGILNFD